MTHGTKIHIWILILYTNYVIVNAYFAVLYTYQEYFIQIKS